MYEIKPQYADSFINDRSIVLPRFQRKQTWDDIRNFQLCISVFKNYPLGVCVLNLETVDGKLKKYLLDGRQRRNALTKMYENPEVIGAWALKFLKCKKGIDPSDLEDLFYDKVYAYLENDEDEDESADTVVDNDETDEDTEDVDDSEESEIEDDIASLGTDDLDLLCKTVLLTYKKGKHVTGFTLPFDYAKYIVRLPYLDLDEKDEYKINGKKVKSFIQEYRKDCEYNDIDYLEKPEQFVDYILSRCQLKDNVKEKTFKSFISRKWNDIKARMELIDSLDTKMSSCSIGLIEVQGYKPADSQKIFEIINSQGVELTAVEILSAKTYWNKKIANPSEEMLAAAQELYKNMNMKIDDVHRWDVPATLLSRLGNNIIFKNLSWDSSNHTAEFEKKLTLGFKVFAGIYEKGITKEDIDNMGKNARINWDTMSESTISEIKSVIKLIEGISYFQFLKSWKTTIMELTSDAVALDFILLTYFDWKRKGCPIGAGTRTVQFQKNCVILWDQLIYEYVRKMWRGSSDSKIANNIDDLDMNAQDAMLTPISKEKWTALFSEIYKDSKVDGINVSVRLMKPILYHMYCLKEISGPDAQCSYDIDHIIPQSAFKASTIPSKDAIQDNLYNLGLLPKKDNISKSNKPLNEISDPWLRNQIEKYEFIKPSQYEEFSKVSNYQKLYEFRKKEFDEAFDGFRDNLFVN